MKKVYVTPEMSMDKFKLEDVLSASAVKPNVQIDNSESDESIGLESNNVVWFNYEDVK